MPVSAAALHGSFEYFLNTCYIDSALSAMFIQTSAFDYLLKPLINPTHTLERLHSKFVVMVNTIRQGRKVAKSQMKALIKDMVENKWPFHYQRQEDVGEFITVFLTKFGGALFPVLKQESYRGISQPLTRATQHMLFIYLPLTSTEESIYKLLSESLRSSKKIILSIHCKS